MSYIALARKWRPRSFSQLVGQPHVCTALTNSLSKQQIHHAYLFTGTRGVGKTSIARLFAKALNCESGISTEPCLNCDNCLNIEQGSFMDLVEIDGASRTRVEDTRELLDNIQYAPSSARFKIYIIDEVHMLSQHSFNALLKTLEEPPGHVKFLLATTDPQKLPITVLSRCLQFHLKPLAQDIITQRLVFILEQEKITYELSALNVLAQEAQGSMRDALSLLDQCLALGNNSIKSLEVNSLLGHTKENYALQLLEALAQLNPQSLLAISHNIGLEGGNYRYILDELISNLHQIAICQTLSEGSHHLNLSPSIKQLSTIFSPEETQLLYQIALKSLEELELAPRANIGFEMALLRMYTFRPAQAAPRPMLAFETKLDGHKVHNPVLSNLKPSAETKIKSFSDEKNEPTKGIVAEMLIEPLKSSDEVKDWITIVNQLKLQGLSQTAIENAEFLEKQGRTIRLRVTKGHQSLFTPTVVTRIEDALIKVFQESIKIDLVIEETINSPAQQKQALQVKEKEEAAIILNSDPFFQKLQQEFSAEVIQDSIVAIKDDL
jgi:DNA polymerase-3 subunit gamma/tau